MQATQFIRQRTIIKFAIIVLFAKVAYFHIFDDRTLSAAPDDYQIYNEELVYEEDWSPELGEKLGLTQKEFRVKRRQYRWRRNQKGGSTLNQFRDEQKVENDDRAFMNSDDGGNHNDVNIPPTMGYYNLSCPFEWYKYSCAAMQDNTVDEQITAASFQYYQKHLVEIWRAFDSVLNDPQQQPKRIFMTGDSLLRQLFISLACNAFSLNVIEQSEIQWRKTWPCPEKLTTKCAFTGGEHSGFDAASIRFKNGMEIHFVPHRGFAYKDSSKGEPDVLERMKWQIDNLGIKVGFGKKTALPPSGPMTHLVYNVGAHFSIWDSRNILNSFVSDIAKPLMKIERRPKIIYVVTPTAHFNTGDGQYIRKKGRMDGERSKCVERVRYNPRAKLEKRIVKAGVNVDVLLEYDDLELGALHVQRGDCIHYCMPGAADLVAARLLESF
mmetsp:Transcript_10022/g.16561  ORF Transcript_10022/g.16561 Transcript_10022/m.16561 type:complete len:438 (-) Transcript_10022:224-1537(-)